MKALVYVTSKGRRFGGVACWHSQDNNTVWPVSQLHLEARCPWLSALSSLLLFPVLLPCYHPFIFPPTPPLTLYWFVVVSALQRPKTNSFEHLTHVPVILLLPAVGKVFFSPFDGGPNDVSDGLSFIFHCQKLVRNDIWLQLVCFCKYHVTWQWRNLDLLIVLQTFVKS